MLISWKWIQDYIEGDLFQWSSQKVMERFTLRVAEVEEIQETNVCFRSIRVVKILSFRAHPEADQLRLVTFQVGHKPEDQKEVVCGAPNVRVGLKVPFAPVGTTLPGGMLLSAKKIRGIMSEGMLCSRKELGLGEDQSGLMELEDNAPVGQSLGDYLTMSSDYQLNIDNKSLTHRPDLWGHWGIAREVANVTTYPLKKLYSADWIKEKEKTFFSSSSQSSPIIPVCDDSSSCLIYFGVSVDNVQLSETPKWMKERLEAVGQRCIHPLVDISNFVMLELGIPLHFFDRQKIQGSRLEIRLWKESDGELFTTLDDVQRTLKTTDTVIADARGPLVLAGLMGGSRCAVDESTTSLFIEVANWKATDVRRTSTRLGLRTDSSQRYEKTLDTWSCYRTLLRTMDLLQQLCPAMKVVGPLHQIGPQAGKQYQPVIVETSLDSIARQLGRSLDQQEVKGLLEGLGCLIKEDSQQKWHVTIPSFRAGKDLSLEADLVEEVGRSLGYDSITPCSPLVSTQVTKLSPLKKWHRKLADFFVLHGDAQEITTYPLVGDSLYQQALWEDHYAPLRLVNALSQDHAFMRTSLVPSHLDCVIQNKKHRSSFRLFEIGRAYFPDAKNYFREEQFLMVTVADEHQSPFKSLVDLMDDCFSFLGVKSDWVLDDGKKSKEGGLPSHQFWKGTHPHEFFQMRVMGKMVGQVASLHPHFLRRLKVGGSVAFACLSLSFLESLPTKDKRQFKILPKFPASTFDCTVVCPQVTSIADVMKVCKSIHFKELQSYHVVDIFPWQQEKKTVTLQFVFQDAEKTLTSDSLKTFQDHIIATLHKGGFPLKGIELM